MNDLDRSMSILKTELGSKALNKLKELRIAMEHQKEENN